VRNPVEKLLEVQVNAAAGDVGSIHPAGGDAGAARQMGPDVFPITARRSSISPRVIAGAVFCRLSSMSCAAYSPLPLPSLRRTVWAFIRCRTTTPAAAARFTTSALDGYGLSGHRPARPAPYASDPVLVHRLVRLLRASFRPSVTGTPLRFAMTSPPSGRQGDFHPRAVKHARHT
jgi:hypothetical protein